MNAPTIAVIACEGVALVVIFHLWLRRKMHWWAKLLWTVFLCIPFFGPLFYGFVTINPEPQEDHTEIDPYA